MLIFPPTSATSMQAPGSPLLLLLLELPPNMSSFVKITHTITRPYCLLKQYKTPVQLLTI